MKIKSVKAFLIKSDLTGGQIKTEPRRPAWTSHAEVAGPMSRFARFKKLRTTWRPNLPSVGVIVTAGILTNAIVTDNLGYRPNTTTAGGSLITVGGTTSTGIVTRNYVQTLTTTVDLLFTTTVGLAAFENRVTGVVGATGTTITASCKATSGSGTRKVIR